jgi:RNA polymerase sigma-70 factor, ECF subfamily
MSAKVTWEALMLEAQKGNSKMYTQLLEEISAYLHPYILFKLGKEDSVSDLVQDVLISLHKARFTFDANYPLKPWLFKIVQSRLIDYYRKSKRNVECKATLEDTECLTISAEAEISQLELNELQRALGLLAQDQRDILVAIKIDGKSIKQIAKDKLMSESAVKVAAHRAYKSLLTEMGFQ